MPFKEHKYCIPPDNLNSIIWRYMDLAKFISILDRHALYFARFDKLSDVDTFEGHYTSINFLLENQDYEDLSLEWKSSIRNPIEWELIKGMMTHSRKDLKYQREVTFVNSWHIKEHESAAMWKIYLSNNEGIAIQSTYKRLVDSLSIYKDFDVFIGKISYIDYTEERIPIGNLLHPFLYKRNSFAYEDELRALIWTPQDGKNTLRNNKYKDTSGLYVAVTIDTLIENVFVAPTAPLWILELIKSLITKYNLKINVKQSDLASSPIER